MSDEKRYAVLPPSAAGADRALCDAAMKGRLTAPDGQLHVDGNEVALSPESQRQMEAAARKRAWRAGKRVPK